MDAMEFFQLSAGNWRSQRTTHHLAFRQAEKGELNIKVATLEADHPQVIELCELHKINPSLAAGGALVSWQGTMAWDQSDDGHKDSTVMVVVPDADSPRQGKLLREKGYAETMPVAGIYQMDAQDGLVLITEYETMSAHERFSFITPSRRMRTSIVKRFGGFSSASFCIETRIDSNLDNGASAGANTGANIGVTSQQQQNVLAPEEYYSILGW
ncbi:phycobiliprotein lyase [Moorena bouillonii PNG]|uniref:Chromophore lyase CpcS/CpeS n=1 Tax=Moorena bouillonii PNG TaxID=568701 RepID=A0A1U7NC98_9CYAN|nr:phycobiliprotein lyase [Moorena bouillonii]OLT63539.1 phycobiliprotein lyase [Moorena bouillonii PNG]